MTNLVNNSRCSLGLSAISGDEKPETQRKEPAASVPVPFDAGIQICINDVTVDTSGDFDVDVEDVDPSDLIKRQWRRSSWCPEEGRKKEEKHEKQRMILAVVGKSQSLSSLEGDDDESDEDDEDNDAKKQSSNEQPQSTSNEVKIDNTNISNSGGIYGMRSGRRTSIAGTTVDERSYFNHIKIHKPQLFFNPEAAFQLSQMSTSNHIYKTFSTVSSSNLSGFKLLGINNACSSKNAKIISSASSGGQMAAVTAGNLAKDVDFTKGSLVGSEAEARNSLQQTLSGLQKFVPREENIVRLPSTLTEERDASLDNFVDKLNNKTQVSPTSPSMGDVYNNISTGDEDEDEASKRESKQPKIKRRGSVFSKIGSYRHKKTVPVVKESGKVGWNNHNFVLVFFSNSATCDVCGKLMANKPALQCENCLLNVHEKDCKDQTFPCVRCQNSGLCNGDSVKDKSSSLPGAAAGTHLKATSQTAKEKRALSVPARTPIQISSANSGRSISPNSTNRSASMVNTGYFQWRRVATKLGIDLQCRPTETNMVRESDYSLYNNASRAISEDQSQEKEMNGKDSNDLDAQNSNNLIVDPHNSCDVLSASNESLDDSLPEPIDFNDDPDLMMTEQEPEAWSVTVDKKTLRKMTAKNIKRQDHIWELIQTEKSHYRNLKIMHKIFANGMMKEIGTSQEMVDRMFPKLFDLLDIHLTFLQNLVLAQKQSADKSIEEIGPVLLQQFEGKMGDRIKIAYGEFCSRHIEAIQFYKDLLKSDGAFQTFIKKCSHNSLCKRVEIPDCILLVTQRITKYPILLETMIKTTADNCADKQHLEKCLASMREILNYVNCQVDAREKEQRLFEIYNKLDARSSAMLNGKKFKKSDLLSNKRKLLYQGVIKWISPRGKPFEVLAVILSDVIFFLAENSQKFTFFSQDNKSGVIPLAKLLVREKGDTKDSKGLYLICQSKTEPEMYEFICKSTEERKIWIQKIRNAIISCPEDGEPSECDEERKLQEALGARLRQLIDKLHQKDTAITAQCQEKLTIALEILEIFAKDDISNSLQTSLDSQEDDLKLASADGILELMLREVTKLFSLMKPAKNETNVIRSFSSVGPHAASASSLLPKRAGTFSGFDSRSSQRGAKPGLITSSSPADSASSSKESDLEVNVDQLVSTTEEIREHLNSDCPQLTPATASSDICRDSDPVGSGEMVLHTTSQPRSDISFNKEHCICIAKLLQCAHQIVCLSSRQTTDLESTKGQLAEAKSKISKLYIENERLSHERKSVGYHPDKQLEELRSLQGLIQQQKRDLDRTREEQNNFATQQKDELLQIQQTIEKQKMEVKMQKEELQRQKEALQRQIDHFEDHKARSLRTYLMSVNTNRQNSTLHEEEGNSIGSARIPAPEGKARFLADSISHQRSASDDILQLSNWSRLCDTAGDGRQNHVTPTSRPIDGRSIARLHSMSAGSSGNLYSAGAGKRDNAPLPMQLMSMSNEQKAGHIAQQLPLKLANSGNGEPFNNDSKIRPSMTTSVTRQQSSSSIRFPPTSIENQSSAAVTRSMSHSTPTSPQNFLSEPSVTVARNSIQRAVSQVTSPGSILKQFNQLSLGENNQAPKTKLASSLSAGNVLPLKLAERPRPKSASASAQAQSHTASSHGSTSNSSPNSPGYQDYSHSSSNLLTQPSKSEKEIMYF